MTTQYEYEVAREIVDWMYGAKNIERSDDRQLKELGQEQLEEWTDWRLWAE